MAAFRLSRFLWHSNPSLLVSRRLPKRERPNNFTGRSDAVATSQTKSQTQTSLSQKHRSRHSGHSPSRRWVILDPSGPPIVKEFVKIAYQLGNEVLDTHAIPNEKLPDSVEVAKANTTIVSGGSEDFIQLETLSIKAIEYIPLLNAIHRAELFKCCATIGYANAVFLTTLANSFTPVDDAASIGIACVSAYRLERHNDAKCLIALFYVALAGNCSFLSFEDLKICLSTMALIKQKEFLGCVHVPHEERTLEQLSSNDNNEVDALEIEFCEALYSCFNSTIEAKRATTAMGIDSREFLPIIFYLLVTNYIRYPEIIEMLTKRIYSVIISRIRGSLLDAFMAYAGFLMLLNKYSDPSANQQTGKHTHIIDLSYPHNFLTMCEKCKMYCKFLLAEASTEELLRFPVELQSLGIATKHLIALWVEEIYSKRLPSLTIEHLEYLINAFEQIGEKTGKLKFQLSMLKAKGAEGRNCIVRALF